MKKCSVCKRKKADHLFRKDIRTKTGLRSECRSCENKKIKKRKIKLVKHLIDYFKEHPCVHCGETNPILLEFDHLRDKEINIANAVLSGWSIKRLEKEVEKCQVLCSNCHTLKTAKDQNWYMLRIINGEID